MMQLSHCSTRAPARLVFVCWALVFAVEAKSDLPLVSEKRSYSTPVREKTPNLYWGDLHLHTQLSADAYIMQTRLSSDDAYTFARGGTVIADNGMEAKLRRPLDFLAITDHAEYLGVLAKLAVDDPRLKDWALGRDWQNLLREGRMAELAKAFSEAIQTDELAYKTPIDVSETFWMEAAKTADRHNQPGVFTTFIGYEWTSMISGDNLHRVVLYKDTAEQATQTLPFSAQDSTDPEDLWNALQRYEKTTGGEVIAIAHNGNVSNGRMFAPRRVNGLALDAAYAAKRARWEPVYETTQVKGDGETHPYLSPDDEFADFETWDEGNISLTEAKQVSMLQYEYTRSALKEGLSHESRLGINPFKFGLIGSTDSHTGLSTTREDNFFGKFAHDEPSAERTEKRMAGQLQKIWKLVASGLAAVWSVENTRDALFQAIKRREVYATTGTRIKLRFFGGWEFENHEVLRSDYASIGYRKGVPMGGDLTGSTRASAAPRFMVTASKDPDGANLDRLQIVKGWRDSAGITREKVFNVAVSASPLKGVRPAQITSQSSTKNTQTVSYSNSTGSPELTTVWRDPAFDPTQLAFYYARVIEIPTPRWTAYDESYFGIKVDPRAPQTLQERAYSSPIWYTP